MISAYGATQTPQVETTRNCWVASRPSLLPCITIGLNHIQPHPHSGALRSQAQELAVTCHIPVP